MSDLLGLKGDFLSQRSVMYQGCSVGVQERGLICAGLGDFRIERSCQGESFEAPSSVRGSCGQQRGVGWEKKRSVCFHLGQGYPLPAASGAPGFRKGCSVSDVRSSGHRPYYHHL